MMVMKTTPSPDLQTPGSALAGHAPARNGLLDALGVAVYTTDADGRIIQYNEPAAEMWGRHPELGVDLWCGSWKLYWSDGQPMEHGECPMAICLKEGREVRGYEALAERPDGTLVPFMPLPSPLFDDEGNLAGAVNVLVDLTGRKKAEAEALAIKDQFLGLVSHELRTPIATIVGNALLLQRHADRLPDESKEQALQDIADEAGRLQGIIENLLLLTRMESGEYLEGEPYRMTAVVNKAVRAFQRRMPARTITVTADGDPPIISGHPGQHPAGAGQPAHQRRQVQPAREANRYLHQQRR